MKKIALASLLAVFAVSGANAATNYFVGGSFDFVTDDAHDSMLKVAPEFGWKLNSNWDLGVAALFGYENHFNYLGDDNDLYSYGADVFARYKVAQLGGLKLLLKGTAGAEFRTLSSDDDAIDGETLTHIGASIVPMVTYNLTESFTLYANLNFLGVYAGYDFENKDLGWAETWSFEVGADSNKVMNTSDFQIGFLYNF